METERLVLRRYTAEDKAYLIGLFTDEKVMKYVGEGVLTEAQAEAWWKKLFEKFYPQGLNIWAVFTKKDLRYVGHAGIYPRPTRKEDWEFVYFLCRDAWGKGYATEIAQRIITYGFEELNLPEVFATVDDEHSTSIRVLEKAGMKFKNYEFDDDGRFSVYSIKKISHALTRIARIIFFLFVNIRVSAWLKLFQKIIKPKLKNQQSPKLFMM